MRPKLDKGRAETCEACAVGRCVADVAQREAWTAVQAALARRVCVPRTHGMVEQYSTSTEGGISSLPSFLLPSEILRDFAATVLGPLLRRDAEHQMTLAPPHSLPLLQYVGGVDISFVKDSNLAVACLVVLKYPSMERCHTILHNCEVTEPYIPGFLAFREVPPLVELWNKAQPELRDAACVPQLLFVDGCGVHHPLRCGLASHLGVLLDVPSVGCAKNFLAVDGVTREAMNALFAVELQSDEGAEDKPCIKPIIGKSGMMWGYAATPNRKVKKPIFISPGHRIGYAEAAALVLSTCKHRVPEPIRAADLVSREYIRLMALNNVKEREAV
ncbi:putative endonuclease V [Trypanosoma grayi]|uniref:putative endonuclease V n=1 Tax=Trypanosoma grayi TaxID=71804 RepID=UPI0004F3F5F6|nr:putative endonuclease V [Trypanosoma grayi]KEG13376.1 putative endonuclease V [Trypanosoma grayi]